MSNRWIHLRDAGLCGSSSPRGVIFTEILKWLYTFSPQVDALKLVSYFRSRFAGDPGLDGCLFELEEILKLQTNHSLEASLLTFVDQRWNIGESINLPLPIPGGPPLNILVYSESLSKLLESPNPGRSLWSLIQLPSGFDVIDIILVDNTASTVIYGIQITRSFKPFAKHHTFDTCPLRSRDRLEKLWCVISNHFKIDGIVNKFFVMLAPNCEGEEFKPPVRHLSDYYFSPTSVMTSYYPLNPKTSNIYRARSARNKNRRS